VVLLKAVHVARMCLSNKWRNVLFYSFFDAREIFRNCLLPLSAPFRLFRQPLQADTRGSGSTGSSRADRANTQAPGPTRESLPSCGGISQTRKHGRCKEDSRGA